CQQHKSYRTF
nr:immunoglobulin light chain junction region [Macaca mulatta]